jgi:hypothetical protein
MGDFSLVVCLESKDSRTDTDNVFKRILKNMCNVKKAGDVGKAVRKVRLYDSIDVDMIFLPFHSSEVSGFKKGLLDRIGKRIVQVCSVNGAKECILPKQLLQIPALRECLRTLLPLEYLYKCVFVNIIDSVCSCKGMNISDMDVAIIKGEEDELFISILKLLSLRTKFITIITQNPDGIDKEVTEIYEETGLSIRLTGDFRNGMKSSGFIINLLSSDKLVSNAKISQSAVILNYGALDASRLPYENPVINGIDIALPKYVVTNLGEAVCKDFAGLHIAEAILKHRVAMEEWPLDFSNYRVLNKISAAFKNEGYRIRGFIGRRSIFKLEDADTMVKFSQS